VRGSESNASRPTRRLTGEPDFRRRRPIRTADPSCGFPNDDDEVAVDAVAVFVMLLLLADIVRMHFLDD
jgi:hypothetical protein